MSIRRKVWIGFGLVLALLTTVGVVTWRTTLGLRRGAELVAQSRDVLEANERLMRFVTDLENAWRGYLLTGNTQYLERCEAVKRDITITLVVLNSNAQNRPEQHPRLKSLDELLKRCFALYAEEEKAFRAQGLDAGARLLESPDLRRLHENVRQISGTLSVAERHELYRWMGVTEDNRGKTTMVVIVGTSLALLVLFGAGVVILSDVAAREQAEEQLKLFAGQLERTNAELQNFASVASHDLQEPLRKILAFGDRLRAKCAPQLGEAGLDYLSRMQNAAQRMSILIQDLLKLTRVTSRAQPFERCDLNAVLSAVVSDLEVAIEQTGAKVVVDPLPAVMGDPMQLGQLFQNLLSNALKFQRPEQPPEIRIEGRVRPASEARGANGGGQDGAECCEITVRDNGIGFEPQYAEQIFVVFQRLHNRSEYDGTGIGLALCRKITDRHNGSIVAKSTQGQGATFVVELPVS